jgi:hypothetical protein
MLHGCCDASRQPGSKTTGMPTVHKDVASVQTPGREGPTSMSSGGSAATLAN